LIPDEIRVQDILAQLQNEIESVAPTLQLTHQQREANLSDAWGMKRVHIFKNYVTQQPLRHSKCDMCSNMLNDAAVRCMYCRKHLCFQCDQNTHLTSPFHRRHLVSSDDLKTLLPNMFIDEDSQIITKGTQTILLIL
jgi:hypothetical protein